MRRLLLFPLALACAPKPVPPPLPPATTPVMVDAAALYGGRASSSVFDRRLVTPDLLSQISVDPALVDVQSEDVPVEFWARQQLAAYLGRRDATLILHPTEALPATASLRGLRFVSGEDQLAATVLGTDEGVELFLAGATDAASRCPESFELPVSYVQLEVVVERADGAAVAWISETAITEPQGEPQQRLHLPPVDAPGFCDALRFAITTAEPLQPSAEDYALAAQQVLEGSFGPLLPIDPL